MEWVWDEQKAATNYRDHRVRFETAMLVFDDPMFLSVPDPQPDDDRWRTIGMVGATTLFVVHTVIDENGVGRIISARRATPRERRVYEASRF
ncbi:BrnT family toxin [Sphingomonas psychrolutea]|uniref:Membrane protein n=1 Tax=Sphingomonas psychrolutea TaxID=1259676 RepID=A0ABQ1H2D1_9SPHN|nr:BrnT family toxin [Sphingomonas psychrolutea]GGA55490.1 membrane protein [Sphingomonas psychrolutea]